MIKELNIKIVVEGIERKVIAGYWKDSEVQERIASWQRTAVGIVESSHIRVMRVADNMRNVAVTEGDKVEAQLKFGWEIDAYPVNEIAEAVAEGVRSVKTPRVIVNRREAIYTAVCSADEQDVILIAGKGHEDYQEVMGVKHHFSDQEAAQEAANERFVLEHKNDTKLDN